MHIILIAVGLLFFLNPMRGVIDVLPDFIGCLLILAGLHQPSALVEKLDEARKSFLRLTLVTLLRTAAFFLTLSVSDASRLMLVTVFSILELIFLIPALTQLIDGFVYASMRYGGDAALALKRKKGKSAPVETVDSFKRFSVIFVSIRALCNILPELVALQDNDEIDMEALPLENFYELFFWMSAIVCLVFGVIWAIREFRYFSGVAHDKALVSALMGKYKTEIEPNKPLRTTSMMHLARQLLIVLSVFSIHFYLDYEDFIPGFLFAVIFIALVVLLDAPKLYTAIGFVQIGVSIALLLTRRAFLAENKIVDVAHWSDAAIRYIPVEILTVCAAALAIFSVCMIMKQFQKQVLYDVAIIGIDAYSPALPKEDAEVIAHLKKRLLLCGIFLSVPSLCDVIYVFAAPYAPWISVLHIIAAVCAIVSAVSLTTALEDYPYRQISDLA